MLFELATALPDLLATASRAAVEQLRPSPPCLSLAQPQRADNKQINIPDRRIKQQARQGQMRQQQQQHQLVDVAMESAMLQVGLLLT